MREILFRGKVVNGSEWVYGYLLDGNRIYQPNEHAKSKHCGAGIFVVDEKTIGQYTGLNESNGFHGLLYGFTPIKCEDEDGGVYAYEEDIYDSVTTDNEHTIILG